MPSSSVYRPYFSPLVAAIDAMIIAGSAHLAYWLRFSHSTMGIEFQAFIGGFILLLLLSSTISGVYQSWRGRRLVSLLRRYTVSLSFVVAILAAFLVFTKSAEMFSRLWLGYFILSVWVAGMGYRVLHFFLLRRLRSSGKNLRRILVITTEEASSPIANSDLNHFGYEITASIPITQLEDYLNESRLSSLIQERRINEIWINLPFSTGSFIKDIVYALRHETVDIRYLPDFEDMQLLNHKTSNIAGLYTLDISCTPLDGANQLVKRAEDLMLGTVITLLITPVCLLIAAALKLSSPKDPVIFKQLRNGIDGKQVKVYKFRSMEVHSEEGDDITQATKGDPRVTKLGAFLRRTSLDELPQFYNVLQGRMSIVGPRPHALVHNEYYKDLVESYMWRHKVKPGITGWAQVSGYRGETDTIDKMEKRVEYDLDYINNWSLQLDIKIIFFTVFKGFFNKNAY